MFQGFSEQTIQFLWGVKFNNERPWFQAHKAEYEEFLNQPLKELAADVQERMLEEFPKLQLNMKVARIYRDARRLYGRGPYKTHLWIVYREAIESETAAPGFYFEICPEGYEWGMGYYCPKPALMEVYRRKIQREPEKLEKLARRLNRQQEVVLEGEEYKRSKGEVSKLLQPWFNRKWVSLSAFHPFDDRYDKPELVEDIVKGFTFLMPFYEYFKEVALEPLLED